MNARVLDSINIGLLLVSLILAYTMPFGIFIAAYAILGPLHYLTELNWLNEKRYFAKRSSWAVISFSAAMLVTIPKILTYIGLTRFHFIHQLSLFLDGISNGVLFLGLWTAVTFILVSRPKRRWTLFAAGIVVAYFLNEASTYTLIIGALLPTVLHVYLFTGLFMFYGAFKNRSRIGHFSVFLLALVPFLVAFLPIDPALFGLSEYVRSAFMGNRFFSVNLEIGKLLNLADGSSFYFNGPWEMKVQTFIAFAYVYHYLNWFSKTSIIGWHKGLQGKRAVSILSVWLVQVVLFIFDYRLGFMSALTFSFWHVFAEFPLNALSVKGIVQHIKQSLLEQN